MKPSASYQNAIGFFRALSRLFFRRIEVSGLRELPAAGGGLVVAWHPNGIVDPVLIATSCTRQITFGARHGLFGWPLLGRLMRMLGCVPIYRADDAQEGGEAARRERNRQSLDALAGAIAGGSLSALFPEGVSHDAPQLADLKLGAARLYYRAAELAGPDAPAPMIIPVGLHYDDKSVFRSRALVTFHAPLQLSAELLRMPQDASEAQRRERSVALTAAIERALNDTVHPTESWELHQLMHRTRLLLRAERARRSGQSPTQSSMQERRLGFERVWRAYYARKEREPERCAVLLSRVDLYDMELRALGIHDEELDQSPRMLSPWLPILFALQAILVYGFLPPILVAGYLINGVPYFLLRVIAEHAGKLQKDRATVKMFGGMLLFPLTWATAGTLAALGVLNLHTMFPAIPDAPWLAAASTAALGALGGCVALRYAELSKETARALRVRFTRRRYRESIQRLRAERAELCVALEAMAEGIELPGRISADGRVVH